MDSSLSPKDEIWFLRVCHHISNAVLHLKQLGPEFVSSPTSSNIIKVKMYEIKILHLFLWVWNLVCHIKSSSQGLDWSRIGFWTKNLFWPHKDEVIRSWERVHDLGNRDVHQVSFGWANSWKGNGRNMWHLWPRIEVHAEFWLRNQKDRSTCKV